ncbi:GNAT family N-acetyltransferase [Streptomyces polychromogenes]|nr:GNAT family N-acetyltransferase [Streptomyces polychromogenes]
MNSSTTPGGTPARGRRYTISVSRDENTIIEAQELRHRVFNEEFDRGFHSDQGREADRFDRYCDHVVISRRDTGEMVGTYRLLPPEGAAQAGGPSAAALFDLSPHRPLGPGLVELGRGCVHPEHRTGAVITMLWAGIIRYMASGRHGWLGGRVTVPLTDGGRLAAICWDRVTAGGHLAPEHYRVRPRTPWTPPAAKSRPGLQLPPKLRGYLLAGAWVCGGFAYDPQHDEVALYLLLSLENTDPHRQNFLLSLAENQAGPHMR